MKSTLLVAPALLAAGIAHAGGVEPLAPLAPTPPPLVAADFSGFYAGLTAGYAFGSYGNGDNFPDSAAADLDDSLSGGFGGITLGYDIQRGNAVFGVEANLFAAAMDGSSTCVNPAFTCDADLSRFGSLGVRAGYLAQPNTLLYGSLGFAQAEVEASVDDGGGPVGETQTMDGYTIGLGVERALGNGFGLQAEINYYDFGEADFQTDTLYEDVGVDMTTVSIGVVRRF